MGKQETIFDHVEITYKHSLLVTGNYKVIKRTYYGKAKNTYTRENIYGFKSELEANEYINQKKLK